MSINPTLFDLAQQAVWGNFQKEAAAKQAVVSPEMMAAGDPAAAGGAPPMDQSMAGGAPPMDPAAMAAMAGGMPPGAMPPGGMPSPGGAQAPMPAPAQAPMPAPAQAPGAAPPMDPNAMPGVTPPPKMKPEQWMQQLDYRMYNFQTQLTAIMNKLEIQLPADAMVLPPGTVAPSPEQALPTAQPQQPPVDPAQAAATDGSFADLSPIQPMDKQGSAIDNLIAEVVGSRRAPQSLDAILKQSNPADNVAAIRQLFRQS